MDTTTELKTEKPKALLPPVNNKTQAVRMAKHLFGPLARVRSINQGLANACVQVYVERGGASYAELGRGPDLQEALENAFQTVIDAQKSGKLLSSDIIPVAMKVNLVEEKRRNLVIKLPEVEDVDVINALYDNEVLDITDLIQVRDMEAIEPYIKKATIRNENRKAELARLLEEAEKAKAEMEAKMEAASK